MTVLQVTNMGGKMIEKARWEVEGTWNTSPGDIIRINIPFKDRKLLKYLSASGAQECVLEKEEDGESVTLGFFLDKYSHFLDAANGKPELETIAWLKPANRTVEHVVSFIMDRESCDPKFLAAIGARKREGREEEGGAED